MSVIKCDIFCAVIDNFGDIGVCWRLARQLVAEHGWQVRLLVDDLHTFAQLCPAVEETRARQMIDGVVIARWSKTAQASDAPPVTDVADVVIEAFACDAPAAYVTAMAHRARKLVWINLEYFSAEDWVADFHLRPSPHPRYPLIKTFFFPGFGAGTGGLLKEQGLDAARRAFDMSSDAQHAWWRETTGGPPPEANATIISLFSYENPALKPLLEQWRDAAAPVVLLAPRGPVSSAIARFFGVSLGLEAACGAFERGNVRAHTLAWAPQPAFDRLLWASHVNFVRGEDSFARAQWAQRPFVWHIYPQADNAHHPKLEAALAYCTAPLAADARQAMARFWRAWNGAGQPDWPDFWRHRHALEVGAREWAGQLAARGELAANLAKFAKSQLK